MWKTQSEMQCTSDVWMSRHVLVDAIESNGCTTRPCEDRKITGARTIGAGHRLLFTSMSEAASTFEPDQLLRHFRVQECSAAHSCVFFLHRGGESSSLLRRASCVFFFFCYRVHLRLGIHAQISKKRCLPLAHISVTDLTSSFVSPKHTGQA